MLAVVFAICGTDRVDIVDRELVDNLHEKKGVLTLPIHLITSLLIIKRFCGCFDGRFAPRKRSLKV